MNLLIAILIGLPIGALTWPLTRERDTEHRITVGLAVAVVVAVIAWPFLAFHNPQPASGGEPVSLFVWFFYLLALLIVAGICSGVVNACKGMPQVQAVMAGIALVVIVLVAVLLYPSGKRSRTIATPQPTPAPVEALGKYWGMKIYSKDTGRYGGLIRDVDSNDPTRGGILKIEWFNGKVEWVGIDEIRANWAIR